MLSHGSDIDSDRIFSPFDLTRSRAVVAAVSGGSDSLAMLLLLRDRLRRMSPETRLLAVTVDHGLRTEARAEAETVARLCAARGIEHRVVSWTDEKPATGIAAAARLARYALLAEAAAAADTNIIVTGHTADDQAETVAMRQARGDGRGLAGMAPATLFDGKAWIVRPLLDARREALRQFLRGQGVDWIDDPTNLDITYERARTRREMRRTEAGVEALLEEAGRAGALRMALGVRAAALIAAHAELPMPGLLRLGSDFAREADDEAAVLALLALLAVMGGVRHLPDARRAAALLGRLRSEPMRATLSRCVVDARKAGIFLYRERRGVPESPAAAGTVWDGRYEIVEERGRGRVDEAGKTEKSSPPPPGIVRAVRATMPQPGGSNLKAVPVLAPWRLFLPSFDLALARILAPLVGAADIPSPPLAGHNNKEA